MLFPTIFGTPTFSRKFFHQAAFDHARLGPEAPRIESGKTEWKSSMCKIWKWWNDVKCRHRTCTETIPLFRISEENESSHPRIQSCSKRFKKLFKRLALSSSETYTVNLVNLNTMDAFLDTTCWHVLDTVACATSQHDTITVNSNYGKKKESESLGMELDDNFFDSWKTSRAWSCKPGCFLRIFTNKFRFQCLHPFGLGLALVTRGLTKQKPFGHWKLLP